MLGSRQQHPSFTCKTQKEAPANVTCVPYSGENRNREKGKGAREGVRRGKEGDGERHVKVRGVGAYGISELEGGGCVLPGADVRCVSYIDKSQLQLTAGSQTYLVHI